MATYVNNLRLKEIATGDESGTWGTSTNTNLELIGEALGYATQASFGSDADATTTIADGAADPARALYFKVTSGASLTATRTLTIAPNTVSKVFIIENATTGSQDIAISQGSGANVTVPNGGVKIIYTDGAGSGAAVVDALTDLSVADSLTLQGPTLTVGDGTAEDTKIVFDGNAQDFYIGLDDSADDLVIGLGSAVGTTPAISVDENQNVTMPQIVTASTSANITQVALTDGTVAWDAKAAANAFLLLEENSTISAPTNNVEGAIISIEVAQHASSGPYTLAWNAVFEFVGDETPTMTATDAKTDIYTFRYNGSKWQNIGISQNLTQS